jgi:hypothetical protein
VLRSFRAFAAFAAKLLHPSEGCRELSPDIYLAFNFFYKVRIAGLTKKFDLIFLYKAE